MERRADDPLKSQLSLLGRAQRRIILTRDRLLLCRKAVTHGYYLRSDQPQEQVTEVIRRFDLAGSLEPFRYCMKCNGEVNRVSKAAIKDQLLPKTRKYYDEFYQCSGCGQIYWESSHFRGLNRQVEKFTAAEEKRPGRSPGQNGTG